MTDENLLHVIYHDQVVGDLTRQKLGDLKISFYDTYKGDVDAVPLSTSMPLTEKSHKGVGLENWLSGLLPDDDSVLEKWRRKFQIKIQSPFGLLGSPVGEDCAGAFSFVKPERVQDYLNRPNEVEWLAESQMAALIRELKGESPDWLGTNPPGRFSLAGAQAKTALLYENGKWGRPTGSTATSHIVKPAIKGIKDHDLNEHLCLEAARRVGISAAITKIHTFENESALFIQRYDRTKVDGVQYRIHQEDLCQAFGLAPGAKYQNEGGPSPRSITDRLRIVVPTTLVSASVENFLDALIWNWLLCATDGHAKNYSLLITGNQVSLAPLYDISSYLPYEVEKKLLKLGMKFGSGYDLEFRPSVWGVLANDMQMDEDKVRNRARELISRSLEAFIDAAKVPEVVELKSDLPARLIDALRERMEVCTRSVESTMTLTSE